MFNFINKLGKLPPGVFENRGFCLYIGLLGIAGYSSKNAKTFAGAWAISTLKGKIYGWNHFVDFLLETEGVEELFDTEQGIRTLILEFLDWCVEDKELETAVIGREMEESGTEKLSKEELEEKWIEVTVKCPKSAVLLVKSAVCHLFHLAFGVNIGENLAIKLWAEAFRKQNRKVERYVDAFDAGQLLD
jgi:hypothetical protein